MKREILVTSALPYANGEIHLGHLLEYIQTDIWARFQRLRGNTCYYVCSDDAHGTPIMLKAQEMGVKPEAMIATMQESHCRDFADFLIFFDHYDSTHSKTNQVLVESIYRTLKENNFIYNRTITQAYDEQEKMFLPDRFVKGTCPQCDAPNQYGDCCEACGTTYTPIDLKNPISTISGKPPGQRESEHFFFSLSQFKESLKAWFDNETIQPEIYNKLNEWLQKDLLDWNISRDAPYFGFEIPDHPGKYFYVWLDAPIGYMASFRNYCSKAGLAFEHYWQQNSTTELHHFIGKDIAYFHTLFWPALLEGAGFRKPTAVHCHGFLTIQKQKMSKSRGTFITARQYLEHLNPEYLRYYFAAKLNGKIEDIDLSMDDFCDRINSNLVGKLINIASRCCGFIHKHFDDEILSASHFNQDPLWCALDDLSTAVADAYEQLRFADAMRMLMSFADQINQRIEQEKPWELAHHSKQHQRLHHVCSLSLILFAYLLRFLSPVLPQTTQQVEELLNVELKHWDEPLFATAATQKISRFKPLLHRVAAKDFERLLATQKHKTQKEPETSDQAVIAYSDFSKLDLRIAQIVSVEAVAGADKLLRIEVDDGKRRRHVLAGIKKSYPIDALVGRQVVFLANLQARKMRFGVSDGMILAAGDEEIFLLSVDPGAKPGMAVK